MMKTPHRLLMTLLLATSPLLADAQTANTPGGQASTGTPLDQTTTTPQKNAPKTTQTTPSTTNPSGSTSTTPSSTGAMSTSVDGSTTNTTKPKTRRPSAKATPPAGDVPTYPAPSPSGTPTK